MTTTSRAAGNMQGLAAFAVCLVTAMTVLDTTIANVSLATIAGNLGASQSQSTWVITFYGVANAIVIPITGWLSAVFGAQRLFLFSSVRQRSWPHLCFAACPILWECLLSVAFCRVQPQAP